MVTLNNPIISQAYLFVIPSKDIPHILLIYIFIAILALISIVFIALSMSKIRITPLRMFYRKISYFILGFLLLIGLFLLARRESWGVLSYRIWYLIMILILFLLITGIYLFYKYKYPLSVKQYYDKLTREKYLPKRKKKK